MIEALNEAISMQSLIWLYLAFFMVHDFEEIIYIESWINKRYEQTYRRLPRFYQPIFRIFSGVTGSQIAFAVALEFLVFIPTTYFAAEHHMWSLFLGFNVVAFLHVFTHIGQSIYFRTYTPGVVTAVFITLPYSLYLFYRLNLEYSITIADLLSSLPYGLIVIPIVGFGHVMAKRLVPVRSA